MRYNYPSLIDFSLTKAGEQSLLFEIHDQAPCLREQGNADGEMEDFEFVASNDLQIASYNNVELTAHTVYLQGSDTEMPSQSSKLYVNSLARDEMHDRILEAFAELAVKYGSFLQGSVPEPEQLSLWD